MHNIPFLELNDHEVLKIPTIYCLSKIKEKGRKRSILKYLN